MVLGLSHPTKGGSAYHDLQAINKKFFSPSLAPWAHLPSWTTVLPCRRPLATLPLTTRYPLRNQPQDHSSPNLSLCQRGKLAELARKLPHSMCNIELHSMRLWEPACFRALLVELDKQKLMRTWYTIIHKLLFFCKNNSHAHNENIMENGQSKWLFRLQCWCLLRAFFREKVYS